MSRAGSCEGASVFGSDCDADSDAGELRRNGTRLCEKVFGTDQRARLTVLANGGQFSIRKPDIQIDCDKSGYFACTKDFDVFAAVARKYRNPLLFFQPVSEERIGQPEHPSGLFCKRELSAFKQERGMGAVQGTASLDQIPACQRHAIRPLLPAVHYGDG